ncbi:MAG: Aspartyl/glutamyl-tRNA(Asn/Gln) amidotransferase subunit B [candidate division WS6 bacterium GW2011_GWF2_39_15]|uniref:Aspartyl/glutamyl-tRNA(Asn/Gln) amidotransferase subunit B n=1 Tax=candidate division WS6 bacterium GW2011_GWF2_39_15 TaxID=1619100 RepID=A0A0G0MZN3_9BACT|nr:MAG: Aspartyl/glutamyl-tRNA(Asn/Gln) amidotransferase subunit B [candidate division WS6 bacterium GW2011_GWF2_39_15]
MSDSYEIVIGLEVHVQSRTKSKMFCSCDANYFNTPPNTHVCPVCFGLPGALPVPNKRAVELCIKTALALNCSINQETKFDRKNYFYPDLPKGFQISQYDQPIGYSGYTNIETKEGVKRIGVTRVHQEEDTGKSIHNNGETLLDFNKSGVPLIEIVSEPDFRSKEEVTAYCKRLRQIVRYLGVSNADMERGEMRFELNMSLRKKGDQELPKYKVEVKNIASISVLEKVIEHELKRQYEILENGQTPKQETRGLIDMTGETVSQRSKENEADYRYFPEPDIPLIKLSQEMIDEIKNTIPELPQEKKDRYIKEYGIEKDTAEAIINDVDTFLEFESITANVNSQLVSEVSKWFVGDYFSLVNSNKRSKEFKSEWLTELVDMVIQKKITRSNAKEILEESFDTGEYIGNIIKTKGLEMVSDTSVLETVVNRIFTSNLKAVEDARRNPNAAMFLVGQAMRELKGQADAQTVKNMIFDKLKQ